MYDELMCIGLDAFTRKYDPYWDIPLNENLPQPAITLPDFSTIQEAAESPGTYQAALFGDDDGGKLNQARDNHRRKRK